MGERRFHGSDGYSAVALLRYSADHMRAAELLFAEGPDLWDSGGYLAHLASEILLKAIILNASGSFPEGHDLSHLIAEAAKVGSDFVVPQKIEEALYVAGRYSECRYPRPKEPIQIGNADMEIVRYLYTALASQLPADLSASYAAANPAMKGNRILMVRSASDESPR